jgi:hypothetical protein
MAKDGSGKVSDEEIGLSVIEVIKNKAEAELQVIAARSSAAEGHLQAAEAARSKADSESGFAFNAKKNAEEHSSFIAQTRGKVEADVSWLASTRKNIEESAQNIAAFRASAESDTKGASEARSASDRDAAQATKFEATAAASSTAAQSAQTSAVAAQQEVAAIAAALASAKGSAEASVATIQTAQAAATEQAAKATVEATSAETRAREAKTALDDVSAVATTLKESHGHVEQYGKDLAGMKATFAETLKTIEGLLPGAASAGLASAFRQQKLRFTRPLRGWVGVFAGTLVALFLSGFVGLDVTKDSWDAILRHFVQRLPLVLPLVWLAIYSGRNYMLALRMQEEYAFKEAVSTAFEGYKREMSSVAPGSAQLPSPLHSLCEYVLRTFALRPGRIYEGVQEDITPLAPVTRVLGPVVAAVVGGDKNGK